MGIVNPGISREARAMIESIQWPGNVRELANALHKTLIFSRGYPIKPEDISHAVSAEAGPQIITNENAEANIRQWVKESLQIGGKEELFSTLMDRFTHIVINEALKLTQGNRTQAAKLLGISRPTLHAKMDKCRINARDNNDED